MNLKDLFRYNVELPGILGEIEKKRFPSTQASMYMRAGQAISCSPTVYKAACAYALLKLGASKDMGLGTTHNGTRVAELPRQGSDSVDICAIPKRGMVYAGTIDMQYGTVCDYKIGPTNNDGTAILFALMPSICTDDEANELLNTLSEGLLLNPEVVTAKEFEIKAGLLMEEWVEALAKLSDNIYQRMVIKGLGTPDINITITDSGDCKKMAVSKIDNGDYAPVTSIGTFRYLLGKSNAPKNKETEIITLKELAGKYASTTRKLTREEKKLVPVLDDNLVIPAEVLTVCNLVQKSSTMTEKMRNFMLKGPAGTGKTMASTLIAYGLNLPRVYLTCHADSDVFDFYGQLLPNTETNKKKEVLSTMPSVDDIMFDTAASYTKLTGNAEMPVGMDATEVLGILIQKMAEQAQETPTGREFTYVETNFVKALRYGWVVEIQEPTTIARPGVLPGLNGMLEQGGMITLPTGERITRHPDAVVIVTTNPDYRGCEDLNQSVKSRMNMVFTMDNPSKIVMAQRVARRTGFKTTDMLDEMAGIICDISEYLAKNDITDGCCGVRELMSWAVAVMVDGENRESVYANAMSAIIEKATEDKEEQEVIKNLFLDASSFANDTF